MAKCSFCGINIAKGTGKIYVQTDGKIHNFCSSKCEKNRLKLKRKARETRWTSEYKNKKETKKSPSPKKPAKKTKSTIKKKR